MAPPASRSRATCAAHSAATWAGSIRPARARPTSPVSRWNPPVRRSHSVPPGDSGLPTVRFKCRPTPSAGAAAPRRAAASSQAGRFTSTDTDDTTPAQWASRMPRFTPADKPKSSAFTTRRRSSGVAPSPVVPPDLHQVPQHLRRVGGEAHRARLVVVAKVHGRLPDREAVLPGDVQALDVEAETLNREAREDQLAGARGEALEPGLRAEDPGQQREPHHAVEDPADHVPRVEIVEEGRAHHVARLGEDAAGARGGA